MSRTEREPPRSMQKEEQEETVKDGESTEEVEGLWPQLMPQGEADIIEDRGPRFRETEVGR